MTTEAKEVAVETGWTKPSSIHCFDDWFRREDFGDRDQLERCWASAQNVAARDRRDSDFQQLAALRAAAREARDVLALLVPYGKIHTVDGVRYPDGTHAEAIDRGERVLNELREIVGTRE